MQGTPATDQSDKPAVPCNLVYTVSDSTQHSVNCHVQPLRDIEHALGWCLLEGKMEIAGGWSYDVTDLSMMQQSLPKPSNHVVAHALAGDRGPDLVVMADNRDPAAFNALHAQHVKREQCLRVRFDNWEVELLLVPITLEAGSGRLPVYWGYRQPTYIMTLLARTIHLTRLLLVLDLDSLLQVFNLESLQQRRAAVELSMRNTQGRLLACTSQAAQTELQAQVAALTTERDQIDCDMQLLTSFTHSGRVTVPGKHGAQANREARWEPVHEEGGTAPGRQQPVVCLDEHYEAWAPAAGTCLTHIICRVHPSQHESSVLIRVRPGVPQLLERLSGQKDTRWEVLLCTRRLAQDSARAAWKMLDANQLLFKHFQLCSRLYACWAGQQVVLKDVVYQYVLADTRPEYVTEDDQDQPSIKSVLPMCAILTAQPTSFESVTREAVLQIHPYDAYRGAAASSSGAQAQQHAPQQFRQELEQVHDVLQGLHGTIYSHLDKLKEEARCIHTSRPQSTVADILSWLRPLPAVRDLLAQRHVQGPGLGGQPPQPPQPLQPPHDGGHHQHQQPPAVAQGQPGQAQQAGQRQEASVQQSGPLPPPQQHPGQAQQGGQQHEASVQQSGPLLPPQQHPGQAQQGMQQHEASVQQSGPLPHSQQQPGQAQQGGQKHEAGAQQQSGPLPHPQHQPGQALGQQQGMQQLRSPQQQPDLQQQQQQQQRQSPKGGAQRKRAASDMFSFMDEASAAAAADVEQQLLLLQGWRQQQGVHVPPSKQPRLSGGPGVHQPTAGTPAAGVQTAAASGAAAAGGLGPKRAGAEQQPQQQTAGSAGVEQQQQQQQIAGSAGVEQQPQQQTAGSAGVEQQQQQQIAGSAGVEHQQQQQTASPAGVEQQQQQQQQKKKKKTEGPAGGAATAAAAGPPLKRAAAPPAAAAADSTKVSAKLTQAVAALRAAARAPDDIAAQQHCKRLLPGPLSALGTPQQLLGALSAPGHAGQQGASSEALVPPGDMALARKVTLLVQTDPEVQALLRPAGAEAQAKCVVAAASKAAAGAGSGSSAPARQQGLGHGPAGGAAGGGGVGSTRGTAAAAGRSSDAPVPQPSAAAATAAAAAAAAAAAGRPSEPTAGRAAGQMVAAGSTEDPNLAALSSPGTHAAAGAASAAGVAGAAGAAGTAQAQAPAAVPGANTEGGTAAVPGAGTAGGTAAAPNAGTTGGTAAALSAATAGGDVISLHSCLGAAAAVPPADPAPGSAAVQHQLPKFTTSAPRAAPSTAATPGTVSAAKQQQPPQQPGRGEPTAAPAALVRPDRSKSHAAQSSAIKALALPAAAAAAAGVASGGSQPTPQQPDASVPQAGGATGRGVPGAPPPPPPQQLQTSVQLQLQQQPPSAASPGTPAPPASPLLPAVKQQCSLSPARSARGVEPGPLLPAASSGIGHGAPLQERGSSQAAVNGWPDAAATARHSDQQAAGQLPQQLQQGLEGPDAQSAAQWQRLAAATRYTWEDGSSGHAGGSSGKAQAALARVYGTNRIKFTFVGLQAPGKTAGGPGWVEMRAELWSGAGGTGVAEADASAAGPDGAAAVEAAAQALADKLGVWC